MSRLATRFGQLKSQQRKALVSYVMAGDPHPQVTVPLLHQMVEAGVDVIELGLPFSDPMADGPVIALAAERALAGGTNTLDALNMVKEFRQKDQETPVVLMGYLNPVEVIGYEKFVSTAYACGVDGILLVDLPPEEAAELDVVLKQFDMDQIFLLAPTSTDERIKHVVKQASGFIYYVSLKGVTGAATLDVAEAANRIAKIKAETDIPVGVGFGISDATSAKAMGGVADAVIVGSAFVKQFASLAPEQAVVETVNKVKELRAALDELV
ncbi:MAG: tryptophan synthase subunit alpha [Pseudomonadales bacterium RIFCSPHIGHO2_12_FULL_40_16]|uniref:Tryptophan synthase alpha chain n=1 Tax=Acinetobacter johnsonii TaxID=40214 RepID=A0A3Q8XC66_ACIJO|nr:tryptophan synthase subunit alpha [Acinetobacter johnsonii]AZN63131.1 tryptophan synthase subunit alpha [Acinetobacter johnsonii]MCF7641138.1 tryptophan synthase subunit alpha [Acinetobacter johnsonii]OFW96712.1 MAG: tryptophan synthase subunit alpha [Acinetobacter sp. RIFCSPHIGHO2_12_41_5]OHC21933.1 MAG: tryptophan synthase subunit alpha [Pseudomonadales bacterium RIFCSPHIGHO2_12_FULL_40_16]